MWLRNVLSGLGLLAWSAGVLAGTAHAQSGAAAAKPVAYLVSATAPEPELGKNNAIAQGSGVSNETPSPIMLSRFEAKDQSVDAVLVWATAQEKNSDRFEIERSRDGAAFERIAVVMGRGNASTVSTYRYRDAEVSTISAFPLYYRLRQVDGEGRAEYSAVRAVQFSKNAKGIGVYPNPAHGAAMLDLAGLPAGEYRVTIMDLDGLEVLGLTLEGARQHPLNVDTLPVGTYIVQVSGKARQVSLPLVKY